MNASARNLALIVSLLAVALLGTLAWRQQQEIGALKADAAKAADAQATLKRELVQAEAQIASARKREVEALRPGPSGAGLPNTRIVSENAARPGMDPMENPAMQKMMATSMRASLDQRYGSLFRQLKLAPAELDRLKDLLTERQLSVMDAMNAARTQGVSPAEMPALVKKIQGEVDESVRALLGDERFGRYENFNQNMPSYTLLDQIERRLSYTNAPLQPEQSEALLRVLIETARPASGEVAPGRGMVTFTANASFAGGNLVSTPMIGGPVVGGSVVATPGRTQISDDTIARAQTVLTPAQTEALRQLQAEQQNQANIMQNFRASAGGNAGEVRLGGETGTVKIVK